MKLRRCISSLALALMSVLTMQATMSYVSIYYPDGEPTIEPTGQRYLFGGKEREHAGGRNTYDFGARTLTPYGRWSAVDLLAEKFYSLSPYSNCAGYPVNKIDRNGLEWKYIHNEGEDPKFEWVNASEAYDEKGNLLPDHYIQAISFAAEGTNGAFDTNSQFNMGTSTATVYKANGSTEEFDACTYPSDTEKFATVPEGRYEAKVGKHKVNSPDGYPALRMSDVGTGNFYTNKIELGEENRAYTDGRTYAEGINIHKAGLDNKTGQTRSGWISKGCLLIDRNQWWNFFGILIPSNKEVIQ